MTEFTKEHLQDIRMAVGEFITRTERNLASFALALLERAEKAEAERDEANDERDDAVDRWARRAREAEATVKDYLTVQAERDRLRAQLDSILANSDSLESGKLADAHAEIARLREKLRAWQEKSDRHESERDSFRLEADRLREKLREAENRMKAWGCPDFDFICLNCGRETPCITEADLRPGDPGVPCTFDLTYPQMIERLHYHEDKQRKAEAERDRLKKELEEATARGPHYIRDSRLRADGMRAAAEIARNLRPQDACTCGNYLSFRNGVPGHLPGCLVGECIEVADEIEGRAEEIDRSNRE